MWERAKCKMCGWAAEKILREKVLKGDCPYCLAKDALEPMI